MAQEKTPDDPSTPAPGKPGDRQADFVPGQGKDPGKERGSGQGGMTPMDGDRPPQTSR